MATINEDLRSFLLSITALTDIVGTKVYELHVPQREDGSGEPDVPFLWFGQAGASYTRCVDDPPGQQPFQYQFDIEVVSDDVAQAIQIANIVREYADSHRGAFGDAMVQGVMVDDQSDSYVIRNPMADLGLAVASLALTIFPSPIP